MIVIAKQSNFDKSKVRSKYSSILPPPTREHLESLRASIKLRGVDEAIVEDENGEIVDGSYRQMICDELGIFCPRQVRQFGSEAEKYELALTRNCARRQLNRKQRKVLVETYLKADPQICDNLLASIIGGIGSHRVGEVRAQLIALGEIQHFEKLRGHDGKYRPHKYARILANSPTELANAQKAIVSLPPSCDGKYMDAITAQRRAKRHRKSVVREESLAQPIFNQDIQLFNCRFQDLETTANIGPNTAEVVFTDIPYIGGFLPEIPALAEFAERILMPGGVFATYSGQYYLDQVMAAIGTKLTYRWMIASVWDGDGSQIYPLNITSQWKPILIFSKGDWKAHDRMPDVSRVTVKEKASHEWQQPLDQVRTLVSYLSRPGDLVVDPCAGSFTTALACRELQRRFIGCDIHATCVAEGHKRLAEERMNGK